MATVEGAMGIEVVEIEPFLLKVLKNSMQEILPTVEGVYELNVSGELNISVGCHEHRSGG